MDKRTDSWSESPRHFHFFFLVSPFPATVRVRKRWPFKVLV